jgi:hypothetical protein
LLTGNPVEPLNLSALGEYVRGNVRTGAQTVSPTVNASTCADWTNRMLQMQGVRGEAELATFQWFASGSHACSQSSRLYCLEE